MLLALWSSSAAMTSIISTLNRAYDIDESRPWWNVRLTAPRHAGQAARHRGNL